MSARLAPSAIRDDELTGPKADEARESAVEPEGREQETGARVQSEQPGSRTMLRQGFRDPLIHRHHIRHRQVGVQSSEALSNTANDALWTPSGPKSKIEPLLRKLLVEDVKRGFHPPTHSLLFNITNHSDDGQRSIGRPRVFQTDPLAEGVLAGPELARHALVDDDHPRTSRGVALVEIAPSHDRDPEGSQQTSADEHWRRAERPTRQGTAVNPGREIQENRCRGQMTGSVDG